MRRGDVGQIEGRILAHQNDIDPGEVEFLERPEPMVVALSADNFERPGARIEPPVLKRQRVGQIMEQGMPAGLCFEGQRKRRIRIDVDRIDRIHLDRDGESHADLLTYLDSTQLPLRPSGLGGGDGENAGNGRRVNSTATAAAAAASRPDAVPCRPERAGRPARARRPPNAYSRAGCATIPPRATARRAREPASAWPRPP